MKFALIAIALIAIAVIVILALAATKPGTLTVQRTIVIAAPPASVFALIADFHNWPRWAPQDREDITMKRTFAGPSSGIGAVSLWTSRGSSGAGRMTVAKVALNSDVEILVDFQKPFVAHNINHFHLEPTRDGTRLIWSMRGTNVYMMKVMSVFTNPDRIIGPHFESGLSALKAVAEKEVSESRPK